MVTLFVVASLAEANSTTSTHSVRSTSRQFLVMGFASTEAAQIATWADQIAQRASAQLGKTLLSSYHPPILITKRTRKELSQGRVVKAQGWVDGVLRQKLILVNPDQMDQEDMLEGLCWLLLNRYAISKQSMSERKQHLAEVPDWLSVGLAQNLYPETRARNMLNLARQRDAGTTITVAELLTKEYLPAGRWPEKAAAGLFYGWLRSQQDEGDVLSKLLARVAHHQLITPAHLEAWWNQSPLDPGIEEGWKNWLVRQDRVERHLGEVHVEHVDALRRALIIETGEQPVRTLDALMALKNEKWVPPFVAQRRFELNQLATGRSEAFRNAALLVDKYLKEVGTRDEGERSTQSYRPRLSQEDLRRLYTDAVKAVESIETNRLRRERFLNEVDATRDKPSAEVTHFLDRVEQMHVGD